MGQRIVQVDAFTSRAFAGNPAAVCVMNAPAEEGWMQNVAMEMNLAETAFLWPEGVGAYRLRWFTPTVEVDLCGHATLASAHTLWSEGHLAESAPAKFETRSGRLEARKIHTGIQMDLPADFPVETMAPEGLGQALGAEPLYVAKGRLGWLVELRSEREVRALSPDFRAMVKASERPVIVTARGSAGSADFVSRFFAPTLGIDEDPVTGAAHCCLAPHWEKRLGRKGLVGYQASKRGGEVRVLVEGDRVFLTGQAVTVMRGELA